MLSWGNTGVATTLFGASRKLQGGLPLRRSKPARNLIPYPRRLTFLPLCMSGMHVRRENQHYPFARWKKRQVEHFGRKVPSKFKYATTRHLHEQLRGPKWPTDLKRHSNQGIRIIIQLPGWSRTTRGPGCSDISCYHGY